MRFRKLELDRANESLRLNDITFTPTFDDLYKMASRWKYTKEIYTAEVDEILLEPIDIYKLVTENAFFVDSVIIRGLDLSILKDKRYPFDESKRPKLPQQSLKTMEAPLYIGKVRIYGGNLKYQEKMKGVAKLMTVTLGDLNVGVDFITSIRDSIRTGKPMKIKLKARLMGQPVLKADFTMPLNSRVDTFFFSGSLGPAKLSIFNKAAQPAIGMDFIKGTLQGVTFKGSANPTQSAGEMTLLYKDLEAKVVKKDQKTTNKFMSWAANAVLKTSNPGKNGKTRVAALKFNRVMYKGFGNFMWKTLSSGITNTLAPAGKQVKQESSAKQVNKTSTPKSSSKTKGSSKTKKKKRNKRKKDNK